VTAAAEVTASGPYHHRSRIELQQKQQQQLHQTQQQQQLQHNHQQMQQQQTRRYAFELVGTRQHAPQHRTAEMTSQQRIERMSRIMKQQNHRPEQMMRFRHTLTLVSVPNNNIVVCDIHRCLKIIHTRRSKVLTGL